MQFMLRDMMGKLPGPGWMMAAPEAFVMMNFQMPTAFLWRFMEITYTPSGKRATLVLRIIKSMLSSITATPIPGNLLMEIL